MSLMKNVNGLDIPCSAEEEGAIRAEWATNNLVVSQSATAKAQATSATSAARSKVTAALKPLGITLAELKDALG
jgi:uncharacterized protein YggE